jgi:hypothetical protein
MAVNGKPVLTEEEIIAKKLKFRRTVSYILMVVGAISIIVFVILMTLTKGNVDTQTTLDTQELRSKVKNIIALENQCFADSGKYIEIRELSLAKELPRYDPKIDGSFKYSFDPATKTATGMEKDASHDINGDGDGNDGFTLSVTWDYGIVKGNSGGNFFWPEEDKADFTSKGGKEVK